MHEAMTLAGDIRDHLNSTGDTGYRDGGAGLQVIVTDTAGNVSEVWHEDGRWVMDDGLALKKLFERLRNRLDPKQQAHLDDILADLKRRGV